MPRRKIKREYSSTRSSSKINDDASKGELKFFLYSHNGYDVNMYMTCSFVQKFSNNAVEREKIIIF